MVALRDDVSEEQARQYVDDVALLAADARRAHAQQADPPPLLTPARERFVRRGALARAWMHDVFEPQHRPQDIPRNDQMLEKALVSAQYVRPTLHRICQLVAVPSGFDDDHEGLLAKAADPQWQERATARFEPVATRLQRNVEDDDPHACDLIRSLMAFETREAEGVTLRIESTAFDLDACARVADDGTCTEKRWAPEWVEKIRERDEPGFMPPFRTRFGWHLAFLVEKMPAASGDSPKDLQRIRQAIHEPWRIEAFRQLLDTLTQKYAVQVRASPLSNE